MVTQPSCHRNIHPLQPNVPPTISIKEYELRAANRNHQHQQQQRQEKVEPIEIDGEKEWEVDTIVARRIFRAKL